VPKESKLLKKQTLGFIHIDSIAFTETVGNIGYCDEGYNSRC
jgi:hypothetical protein